MAKQWRQRMLSTTRGRVLALLRWGPRTVNDLSRSLELTDNAVRIHLSALERDGLVEQEGVRRGVGKPAHVFQLTPEAEALFPKAYASLLGEVLSLVREREGEAGLEAFLRTVGQRAGDRARAGGPDLRHRVDAAVALLGELGGLAEVEESPDSFLIRGYSCPLAALIPANPEACALAEELVGAVVGTATEECCDRSGGTPRCAFRVARETREAASPACD